MASQGDQVPLLSQQNEGYEEPPDTRFAIDEETAEAQEAQGQSDPQQQAPPDSPKYDYPPSYREATGKSLISDVFSRLFSADTMPDMSFLMRGSSKVWLFICKFWPTSRFAQVGFFMLGLWLLVIVSGPAFEEAGSRAGSGYPWSGMQEVSVISWRKDLMTDLLYSQLANNGPGPISGDGHPISLTNWTLRSCQNSIARHGQVLCTSTSKLELDIPPAKAIHSNEGLFIFADPPREDRLGDNRGTAPGTIDFKLVEVGNGPDQVPEGKVHVVIDAEYEQNKLEVFERSTIVKMASRRHSQGIGIYTFPLPARYQRLDTAPLTFHIKVLVPAGSLIPAFRTDASAMNVAAFAHTDSPRAATIRDAAPSMAAPTFGKFAISTASGNIRTGGDFNLKAIGMVHLQTRTGDISVSGETHAQEVRISTIAGNIRLEEGCQVTAWREAAVTTKAGTISLQKGSWIMSQDMLGKAESGAIEGGIDGGVWRTNKTLQLHTSNGAIRSAVEVVKPTDQWANKAGVVYVDAESKNGLVDVSYVNQDKSTALHGTVKATIGEAKVKMHSNFEGLWTLEGTIGSNMIPPADGDPRHLKTYNQKGSKIKVKQQGELWFDPNEKHREQAQMYVSSTLGKAQLSFA
jgi:hypothetical protein